MRVGADRGGDATTFDADRVRFVLVQPKSAGNVGSAARALKNLGFSRLVVVDPQYAGSDTEARRMAVDAGDVLEGASVHAALDSALAGARTVVGATRRGGKHRRPHWRLDELAPRLASLAAEGELAFVFGREDHGLSDPDLDLCTHLIYLPSSAEYASLNLAQAVLLVAYELRLAALGPPDEPALEAPADHEEREAMYRHLQQALEAIGFVHPESVEQIMRRFRRLLGRADLAHRDVKLVRGLARQTLWAAAQSGRVPPPIDGGADEQQD